MSKIWNHYESVKQFAREKRSIYGATSREVSLIQVRKIYKAENIRIKYASPSLLRNLKAAYFNDENGIDVLVNPQLPKEAKIFALIHELKHHYCDANEKDILCLKSYDEKPIVEKTAEVFAAEFIWPENDFVNNVTNFGIGKSNCTPRAIVKFKKEITIPVSYTFIKKRLEWFGIIDKGEYDEIKFRNLEYEIYGKPFYLRRTSQS